MTNNPTPNGEHERVHKALDEAFARASRYELELDESRFIVFSDHHRGAKNGADNFHESEASYLAALRWYFERDYTLVLLGDVEELWQEKPADVLVAYEELFALEADFHQAGRLLRVWGNHDDDWQDQDLVARHLQDVYGGEPLTTHEALAFTMTKGGRELGTVAMIHGHQGSAKSDRWRSVARPAIRHLYRPFQRLTGLSLDTPSKNWRLREAYDAVFQSWAAARGVVLMTGHTHRPTFESHSGERQLGAQLETARAKLEANPDDEGLKKQTDELQAELEAAEEREADEKTRASKPCYFNTGCCCFPGGDITGIELADGEIRLVHWPDEEGRAKPMILGQDALEKVFAHCGAD